MMLILLFLLFGDLYKSCKCCTIETSNPVQKSKEGLVNYKKRSKNERKTMNKEKIENQLNGLKSKIYLFSSNDYLKYEQHRLLWKGVFEEFDEILKEFSTLLQEIAKMTASNPEDQSGDEEELPIAIHLATYFYSQVEKMGVPELCYRTWGLIATLIKPCCVDKDDV